MGIKFNRNKNQKLNEKDILLEADEELKSISKNSLKKVSELTIGDVISFKYNAKHKDKYEKYDANPLAIVIDVFVSKGQEYMYAINLHWITPPSVKARMFEIIVKNYLKLDFAVAKNFKLLKKRFIRMTYNDIKNDPQLSKYVLQGKDSAFRMYITKRMKDVRRVPIKYYNIIFTSKGKNLARARWAYKSKGFKIAKFN